MGSPQTSARAAALAAACAALLTAAAPASAQQLQFTAAPDIVVPNSILQAIATGDFNSDTHVDVVVGDYRNERVVAYLGDGNGRFARAGEVSAVQVNDIAVGDFDADGTQDLAIGAYGGNQWGVLVARGRGNGTFDLFGGIALSSSRADHVAIADFNADGRNDIAAVTNSSVWVRLHNGSGTFSGGDRVDIPGGAPRAVAAADLTGDGTDDVAVVVNRPPGGGENQLAVFPGKGDGTLGAPVFGGLPNLGNDLAVGDFDADAREDLAAPIYTEHRVSIRRGVGNGTLDDNAPDLAVGRDPSAIVAADFDADGHEDLAVSSTDDNSVSIHRGSGDGTFSDRSDVAVGEYPYALAAADVDSDGRLDFLTADLNGDTVSVRLGAGPPALAGNLLVNGGFEQGIGARLPTQSPAVPGWTVTGGMTAVRYGTVPSLGFPALVEAPRYGNGGRNFLWGGDSTGLNGITTAAQTVDVAASAEGIDAGRATATLSAYLGGATTYADTMDVTAEFVAGDGTVLGDIAVGPVTRDERRTLTTLLRRATSGTVPAGTRSIRVRARSIDGDTVSSAIADNVKLTIEQVPPLPAPGPGPGGGGPGGPGVEGPPQGGPTPGLPPAAFGRATNVTVKLASSRVAAKGPVQVVVANANGFGVTGSVSAVVLDGRKRLGTLRARRFTLAASGRARVRLALPASVRKRLARGRRLTLRLSASVADPAGGRRTVKRTQAVRRRA